jgi:hypothetical protein
VPLPGHTWGTPACRCTVRKGGCCMQAMPISIAARYGRKGAVARRACAATRL